MTDLTVLISPIALPLYPASANQSTPFLNFSRGTRNFSHPYNRSSAALNQERGGGDGRSSGAIMVTLETEVDSDAPSSAPTIQITDPTSPVPNSRPVSRGRQPGRPEFNESFLSPPPHTWKARSRPRGGHRSTRSQSAPPSKTEFQQKVQEKEGEEQQQRKDPTVNWVEVPYEVAPPSSYILPRRTPKRSFTSYSSDLGASSKGGELIRPPPPLLRPTTFWRKTRKSGVAAASFSPSSHLIRRSTFIAAGLSFDAPIHDLSAYCVESRVTSVVVLSEQQLQ